VPFSVTKGYDLPAWVNESTLLICSSYSGNTEETLTTLELGIERNAKIVIITSGGKLLKRAQELGIDYIQLPAGKPSPRACLGYSFVQQIYILKHFRLIGKSLIADVRKALSLLKKEQKDIQKRAKILANSIHQKTTIIYTSDRMEAVAIRFRQQLNENAKVLCWHHVIPEMNHNELVGWTPQEGRFAVIMFRNSDDFKRNGIRMDITKDVVAQFADTTIELWSKGDSLCERSMYYVHLGDWVSFYLSELRSGTDANEVKVIDYLKNELSKA
jgi:glucose/mannose-6-phosphate isomerase